VVDENQLYGRLCHKKEPHYPLTGHYGKVISRINYGKGN
jgi:hypothetical protein